MTAGAACATRPVRVIQYCPWADGLQPVAEYLRSMARFDVRQRVPRDADEKLLAMARLDCDWHVENVRVLDGMRHPELEFRAGDVVGARGLGALAAAPVSPEEESWLVLVAQHPQSFAPAAARLFAFLRSRGMKILLYAYDEASRTMPCFREIAPHLDVLIHDECPLDPAGAAALRDDCVRVCRSWVANLPSFAAEYVEQPEERIVFLGSEMGLTPHRRRQIEFLRARFGARFTAIHDHSVPVAERHLLARRFKVSVCPEGRKFGVPTMARSHTDRPFWSGCLGLVPVSEDAQSSGRLEELHRAGLILRYPHGDLDALAAACERALALPDAERRRIYDHFNREETIGTVVAAALVAAARR